MAHVILAPTLPTSTRGATLDVTTVATATRVATTPTTEGTSGGGTVVTVTGS